MLVYHVRPATIEYPIMMELIFSYFSCFTFQGYFQSFQKGLENEY